MNKENKGKIIGLIVGIVAILPFSIDNYLQNRSIHYPLCIEYPGYNSALCFLAKLTSQINASIFYYVLPAFIIFLAISSIVYFYGFSWKIGIWAGLTTITPVFLFESPDTGILYLFVMLVYLVLPSTLSGLIAGLIASKLRE